jgi:hypothetical protein
MFEIRSLKEYKLWIQHQGGNNSMRKTEETQMDLKRDEIIQRLVEDGIFKLQGKHLYELPLYALMKAYIICTE